MALFQITMAKEEGSKTVVLGGKNDVQQEYTGTVGGQSTDFSTIDTEVKVCNRGPSCDDGSIEDSPRGFKSTQLKNNPLAPPDLYVVSFLQFPPASLSFCTHVALVQSLTCSETHGYSRYNSF